LQMYIYSDILCTYCFNSETSTGLRVPNHTTYMWYITSYYIHCKPIPCNENRISMCSYFYPVIIAWILGSLQGILSLQGSCFHYRDIPACSLFYLYRIAVYQTLNKCKVMKGFLYCRHLLEKLAII
jgi:hypothetical protein